MATDKPPYNDSDLVDISWYNENKRIIHWKFKNGWHWHDFFGCVEKSNRMSLESQTTFVVLADFSKNPWQPNGALHLLPTALKKANSNFIGSVTFGSTFVNLMVGGVGKLVPPLAQKLQVGKNLDDCIVKAHKIIHDYDHLPKN
ncbi:MAG: hypothetical protein OHK0046_43780 [Anaerolineae bacterium]